ncbi:DUF3095 family protein [Nitrincola alkalilacustris]|uniref:DUF3095 family protein n=1 Tax=Nitrincola alkalilacustris TaxID=1571224 RepID=UPI00124EE14F|nr:DUF3095 family protein [Nitrincola alkalilacustris]
MLLSRISDFEREAGDQSCYQELSDGWSIAVADVIASTQLALAGRDRDVNFIAACVVAVLTEVMSSEEAPAAIQFGGDGAVAAVPEEHYKAVESVLAALAYWSQSQFGIPLRVGLVPVADLKKAGHSAYATLHDMGNGNAFGLFLGTGIIEADRWVKQDSKWRLSPREGALPGIDNLSCRWQPLPAKRGKVMCMIIDPLEGRDDTLKQVLADISACVPGGVAAPVGPVQTLTPPAWPSWQSLRRELRLPSSSGVISRVFRAFIGSGILHLAYRLGGRLGGVDAGRYLKSLVQRTDYRKQAGGPRLVLDVTEEEIIRIEEVLRIAEYDGRILYGTSFSDAATMTCLVGDFQADRHVHFVDGEELGFWRASLVLKDKLVQRMEWVNKGVSSD